ncbi:PIR protein [Plasmodium vivax]|nr:PIR protein [Plasmodium vivax]
MTYGRTRPRNNVRDIITDHHKRSCLNKYYNLKGEIEHQITELNKSANSLFCRKCGKIKQDILKKKNRIKFLKGTPGCNQSTAQPKTEEGKSQPRADAETSKIIGLEGQASVKQGQEHGDGGKSRSANLQAKPGTTLSHSLVGTHDEDPQQLDNEQNTTLDEGATQLEGLSHEPPSTASKIGDPSHQHSSQGDSDLNCTPQETISGTKCIQKNSSNIKNLDDNLPGTQTADDGIVGRQDVFQDVTTSENPDDRSTSGQTGGDEKANAVGDSGGVDGNIDPVILTVSNECPNPGTPPCENGGSKHSGDQISNTEAVSEVTSGKVHTESTSDSHSASGSIGAGNDSDDAANNQHLLKSVDEEKQHGQETAHAEAGSYKSDKPTNNPQLHQSDLSFILTYLPSPSGQNLLESNQENHEGVTGTLGRSSSATAEVTEEIVKYENVLGILSQFFNKIPHKDYIMMGFIPMAFIPLLILLMKYTPLRAIFAKKKKKKRNDMNEKLQRVLFEPSNGSEEKRIPFSYSAFEYSS